MMLDLADVQSDLRLFIQEYKNGHRSTAELVSREGLRTRKHITTIAAEGQAKVELHVTRESTRLKEDIRRDLVASSEPVHKALHNLALDATSQASEAQRERLLRSLKYPGFNGRRNQVRDAYVQTYRWVFAGDDDDDDDDDDNDDDDSNDDHDHDHDDMDDESSESDDVESVDVDKAHDIEWDSFSNWLMSTNTFYWISGKPGSGKTTLVKYILSSPKTKQCLDIWKADAVVVSHFFWRPGSNLQHNTKGLLCSLLWQLLSNSPEALGSILSTLPGAQLKDSDSDWSVAELLSTCLRVMRNYDSPICLFLDGIDEFLDANDDVMELLRLIHQLAEAKNTKFCLSSRPEPLLQKHLSNYAQLRLQDLTKEDLTLYAEGHLDPQVLRLSRGLNYYDIVEQLVHKAQGVFLWLYLAIRSINIRHKLGDDLKTIMQRIDSLPAELHHLYRDMWQKSCAGDPRECSRLAALYFKLVMHYPKSFRYEFGSSFRYHFRFGVLELMLASTSLADTLLGNGKTLPKPPPAKNLLEQCKETERRVNVYCAGLLELVPDENIDRVVVESWYGGEYDQLAPFTGERWSLQFIHRTATDFLLDTNEGHSIMSHCSSSEFELATLLMNAWLARACLIFCYIPPLEKSLHRLLSNLHSIHREFQTSVTWDGRRWNQLVSHCQRLSNARRLYMTDEDRVRLCMGHDFLLATTSHGLTDYVHSALNKDNIDADTKFETLLAACLTRRANLEKKSSLVKRLLKAGADPRRRGYVRIISARSNVFGKHMSYSPMTAYLRDVLTVERGARGVDHDDTSAALDTITALFAHGSSGSDQMCFYLAGANQRKAPAEFAKVVAWNSYPGSRVLACLPVRTVLTRWMQNLRSIPCLAGEVSSLGKAMGTQNDNLESYHKLWLVNANESPVDADGVPQVPDMDFWEFPATEWRAQTLQTSLDWVLVHRRDRDLQDWEDEQAKGIISECQAEVVRGQINQGEGNLFDRLEEFGLVIDATEKWSTRKDLVAETKQMVREQEQAYGDNIEGDDEGPKDCL